MPGLVGLRLEGQRLRFLDEPAGDALDAFAVADVALPVGAISGEQGARRVELIVRVEAFRVRLELVEEPRETVACRDPLAAVEVDEPAPNAVAVRAPRVLRDPVGLVDRQPLACVEPGGEHRDERLDYGDGRGRVVGCRLRVRTRGAIWPFTGGGPT